MTRSINPRAGQGAANKPVVPAAKNDEMAIDKQPTVRPKAGDIP